MKSLGFTFTLVLYFCLGISNAFGERNYGVANMLPKSHVKGVQQAGEIAQMQIPQEYNYEIPEPTISASEKFRLKSNANLDALAERLRRQDRQVVLPAHQSSQELDEARQKLKEVLAASSQPREFEKPFAEEPARFQPRMHVRPHQVSEIASSDQGHRIKEVLAFERPEQGSAQNRPYRAEVPSLSEIRGGYLKPKRMKADALDLERAIGIGEEAPVRILEGPSHEMLRPRQASPKIEIEAPRPSASDNPTYRFE